MRTRVGAGALLWSLVFNLHLAAQMTTASISGTVKDETGAVLPGVSVVLKNLETGVSRSVVTGQDGRYYAADLPLGNYEVQSELVGFQTAVRTGIKLTVGREAIVDFSLKVGEITERITVTGEAPLVETTSSSVGGLVDEKKVRDLPLNARSLIELAPLQTGIVFAEFGSQAFGEGFGKKISIGGNRFETNLFQLDGTNVNDSKGSAGSAAGVLMGVETIREFNIITNAYSAEYGKHTGGVFNAVTKSGTNELHGSVFEFLRNDNLDARNFFDGEEPPEFKRNQFGFSVGGPIAKNRTFAFGSYEGLRESLGLTQIFNVPSQDMRRGFLPDRRGDLNFVGVAPAVRPFLESFPLPNGRDFGDGRAEHVRAQTQATTEDFFTVRVDHHFSPSDSLFVRYTFNEASRSDPGMNISVATASRSQYLTVSAKRIFSSSTVNTFAFGFNRSWVAAFQLPLPGAVFPRTTFTDWFIFKEPIGSIDVTGLTGWGGGGTVPKDDILNSFQYKDDLIYSRGRHLLKVGFDGERWQLNTHSSGVFDPGGAFGFASLEDFLRGRVDEFATLLSGRFERYYRQTLLGFYVQDDVKLTPRVTVNLGLRYEPMSQFTERYGRVSNVRKDFRRELGITANDLVLGNPLFKNPSWRNFAPRVGLAWDPTGSGKTSVRLGAGRFFEHLSERHIGSAGSLPPFRVRGQVFAERVPAPIDFPDTFFTQRQLLSSLISVDPFLFEPDQPSVWKWGLDLQREVAPGTVVEIGYSGMRGAHLLRPVNWQAPIAEILPNGRLLIPESAPTRHPTLSRMRAFQTDADSFYHALRLSVERRFARQLQFQFSYTLAKSIDDGSSTGSGTFRNEPATARYLDMKDRGLSGMDVRQHFTFNASYDLPGAALAGPAAKVLGRWSLSAIARLSSGHPFEIFSGAKPRWMRNVEDYPDLAPGAKEITIDSRNVQRYYDPSAFRLPLPRGLIGNLGRGVAISPGIANLDLVLAKSIPVKENVNIQFRTEFFNVFNRANFSLPDRNLFDPRTLQIRPTVGRITETITASRQIQLAAKLLF